jgi:hypothetical protein
MPSNFSTGVLVFGVMYCITTVTKNVNPGCYIASCPCRVSYLTLFTKVEYYVSRGVAALFQSNTETSPEKKPKISLY